MSAPGSSRGQHGRSTRLDTFDRVVDDYILNWRPNALRESHWFAIQRSLDDAITTAGMAISPNKNRLNHQRRIPRDVLAGFTEALFKKKRAISAAATFNRLHDVVGACASEVHGIGVLTAYDTATRLGAFLKLKSARVYLHAGTFDGARSIGFGDREWILVSELPRPFRRLTAADAEDCLCIYKRQIASIVLGSSFRGGTRRRGC